MKRTILITSAFVFLMISIDSCKKASDDPAVTPVTKFLGWSVGTSDGHYGTVLHTSDGKKWVRQGDSTQLPNTFLSDILILDEKTLLLVGGQTPDGTPCVYKSTDGGKNWKPSGSIGLGNVNYGGIANLGKDHIWIVGEEGSIYRSDDVAESWTKIEVPAEYQQDKFLRVAAKSLDDIWVVGDNHVSDSFPIMLHTMDGGTTWERQNPIKDLEISVAKQGHFLGVKTFGNSVWALGGYGEFVIRSTDNGSTWTDITPPTIGGDFDANDIVLLSEEEAYVSFDNGNVFSTSDAGIHWTEYYPNTLNYLTGITVVDNVNIWVCGLEGGSGEYAQIMYSSDAGTTWQDQTPDLLKNNLEIAMYKIRMIKVEYD